VLAGELRALLGDVLIERPSEGYVDKLMPSAEANHGRFLFNCFVSNSQFSLISVEISFMGVGERLSVV